MPRSPLARALAAGLVLAAGAALARPALAQPPVAGADEPAAVPSDVIAGQVRAADTGEPVPHVRLELVGTRVRARSGADGRFTLRGVPAGAHTLRVRHVGFRPLDLPVAVGPGAAPPPLAVALEPAPVPLASVVVTPGQYGVLHEGPAGAQSLSREQIAAAPQVGEDLFRIASRLPGVSASDYSAAFRVRGGAHEEVLVTLDGVELYEPFHLKDFDGALSIVDLGVVGGLDLNTGGFGARYGNRLAGVMDVRSVAPDADGARTELALTLTSVRATSRGGFAEGRGGWLWSVRRGFLEHALRLAGEEEEVRPRYYDVFGKLTFAPAPAHDLALHVLHAADRLRYDSDPAEPTLVSGYGSSYVWLTWQARLAERLRASTVVSVAGLDWRRDGDRDSPLDREPDIHVRDRRDFQALGVRQDWTLEQSERAVLTWGVDVRRLAADYDYHRRHRALVIRGERLDVVPSEVRTTVAATGNTLGAWAAQRLRAGDALTVEAGLRLDRQVRAQGAASLAEWHWGPRLAASYAAGARTTVRAAWGRYWQAQGVHELQVPDSLLPFARGELAEHRVAGVEHRLGRGVEARLEAYERRTLRARPRFSGVDNALELLPELGPDRRLLAPVGGVARGVELLARRVGATGLSWSAGYALARADDEIAGRRVPRPLDQRHTVTLDGAYRPSAAWTVGATWVYHTGWPTTRFTVRTDTVRRIIITERTYGPRNADRMAPYHRLDARVTRRFDLGGGRLALFVDVFNVYDRRSPRSGPAAGALPAGRAAGRSLGDQFDAVLPRVPSFGVIWER